VLVKNLCFFSVYVTINPKERKTEEMSEGIAYQNKDITSKILAEKFTGKSLNVYGFNLPKIKEVLPTNLPAIQEDELRLDNLFL